jgi:hypothetical protein
MYSIQYTGTYYAYYENMICTSQFTSSIGGSSSHKMTEITNICQVLGSTHGVYVGKQRKE